jgi:hypothetical protein
MWYGATDFSAMITPRGSRASKEAESWEEE